MKIYTEQEKEGCSTPLGLLNIFSFETRSVYSFKSSTPCLSLSCVPLHHACLLGWFVYLKLSHGCAGDGVLLF